MLLSEYRSFISQEWSIHVNKESDRWYKLQADVVFMTHEFREFQLTVIEETLWQISELINNEDLLFDDVIHSFESILQDANEKLVLFADKMTSVETFDIRWIITISQHTSFVSAVIGDTSLVLVRKGHVGYTMQNDTDTRQKISLFSDIIEWDIHRDDILLFFWSHISALLDRDDMEAILQKIQYDSSDVLLQARSDDLATRVSLEDIGLIVQLAIDPNDSRSNRSGFSLPMPAWVRTWGDKMRQIWWTTLLRLQQKIKQRQFVVLLGLIWIFLAFVVWSIIHGWIKNQSTASINADGTTTARLSIEDIKKEIFAFQKLDPTSDEKSVKYKTLLEELNRLQAEGKWANDVQELKKILNTEYLQGFNIIMLDNVADQTVYQFSSLEASTLSKPIGIFFHKGMYIAGSQWAILGWISTDIRGTSVRNATSDSFETCSMNLLKNGLYCVNNKNGILHIAKAGAEVVWGENIVFPGSIIWLSTFGSSNFYVLTNDPAYTKDNVHVIRYTNVLWSQNTFGWAMVLPLLSTDTQNAFSQDLSSLAIDGTFLVWSKAEKTLYQLFRNPQDKALTTRAVPMKWGTTLDGGFSEDVKVITSQWSRYVYLYDRKNHTLTSYFSAPAKNSDAYSTSYNLEYVMRLDFSALEHLPVDVTVDESDGKQTAYVLQQDSVAKIPMSDLLETLKKTRQQGAAH